MRLRAYQTAAITALRPAVHAHTRVILYSPTGSGKTECAIALIQAARAKGTRVLFVCHRVGLVAQASKRFSLAGLSHGIVQGANTDRLHEPILIASIQSLHKRGYPEVGLIVIDEAHTVAGSSQYLELLECYNAIPVVGLTATPFSTGLGREYPWGKPFGAIISAATIRELIDQDYLVDVEIYAPSTPDLSKVQIVAGDYNQTQLGDAVDQKNLIGDIVSHWQRLANDKPTVVFATNIAHSKHIAEQFNAAGIICEHIDCYTPDEDRAAILARVDSGATRVVTNVGVLAEGWDSPSVEVMICARPTRSLIRWIQMAGRILRPFPGKKVALILDHSGTAARLGFPTDDLPLELDDGKVKKTEAQETPERLPKVCPKCTKLKPVGVHICPSCGFVPERQSEVIVEVGELTKLAKLTKDQKQELYSSFLYIAQQKGYSHGWVSHTYKGKTGVWPKGLDNSPRAPTQEALNFVRHKMIKWAKRKNNESRADNAAV